MEIRRRYAIAWVEYIDLSRPRPPRSHRHCRCYLPTSPLPKFLLTSNRTSDSVFDCGKSSFPARVSCTSTSIHLYRRPVHATSVRSIIVPGIDDVALVMPGLRALIHEGYIHIHVCDLSMILCRMTNLCTGISSYLSSKGIGKCYEYRLTYHKHNDVKLLTYIAPSISCSFNIILTSYIHYIYYYILIYKGYMWKTTINHFLFIL